MLTVYGPYFLPNVHYRILPYLNLYVQVLRKMQVVNFVRQTEVNVDPSIYVKLHYSVAYQAVSGQYLCQIFGGLQLRRNQTLPHLLLT